MNMRNWLGGWIICVAAVASADAPAGWADRAFGDSTAGYSSYFLSGNELTITVTGEGSDIWSRSDTGRYVFIPPSASGQRNAGRWLAGARFLQVLNWVQFGIREGFWQG